MRNMAFVIWMVGYPIANSIGQYVNQFLCGHTFSDSVMEGVAIITLAVWAFVGYMLYEKK